ncbi:hypothetical protein JOC27_002737, partial [Sporolactobacillus spathodeae]|nr:hypothetical protein [Sporolactobacillus spathodeae]
SDKKDEFPTDAIGAQAISKARMNGEKSAEVIVGATNGCTEGLNHN